ncbi:MAG TPA: glycine cleavage T C-terminal barrel domain-containing protein [Fimbriimonadaceae bacterium]|nr:glycine cleavage T C-terminal barrel domain-containing protein [Fimbriimonadaceae bacterium]HRJ97047.1 glycine cleavage T C-terminal barrel domain-containing protein [Fimbriimonadaceae bacterium]
MCETLGAVQDAERFEEGYRLLREECGLVDLSTHRAIVLTGEDAKGWLQGQVTNDLRKLEPGGSLGFCLCKPTGQLEAICTIWWLNERFVVVADELGANALLDRVAKMVILEDVQATRFEGSILSVQGPGATRSLAALANLPALDAGSGTLEGAEGIFLRSNRSGYGGWDILLRGDAAKATRKLKKQFPSVADGAFLATSLETGIPLLGTDTDEKTLPPELGQSFVNANVSYTKGCYTGQEVLMRIHSRGHTNRTWVGLLADERMEPGDQVAHLSRDDAGRVTRASFSPEFGWIGAAMVRNEVAFGGEIVRIRRGSIEFEAEVQEMPFLRMG